MRIALIALPHVKLGTPTTHLCAYSKKVQSFCRMMGDRHDITLYAPEGSDIQGATLVECISDEHRRATFGEDEANRLPTWPTDEQCASFNTRAIIELQKWLEPRDLIFLSGGWTHKPIADAFQSHIVCEGFVGYEGVLGGRVHAAYESYFHMAQVAWKMGFKDIRWYDRVIPPFVDPDEFPHHNQGNGQYLLFVGRLISRKGPHIAHQIAKAAGLPLVVAGAGGRMEGTTLYGQDVTLEDVIYRGPVGIEERAKLMAGARATIVSTTFAEPGCNVAIESMMAGTPVICPDWGVLSETVLNGVSGAHFRTLKEAIRGVNTPFVSGMVRWHAETHYSLTAIGEKFDAWFDDMQTLWKDGWPTL